MERKIGEIFEYNGDWYQRVEQIGCDGCAFDTICDEINDITGNCTSGLRHDDESVVFKKLEKVGEPYPKFIFGRGNIKVQRYKLYRPTNTNICNGIWIYHWNENLVDIEIKQNKEDMETTISNDATKHSNSENIGKNLKPFDLEAAKAGKPICTRDGKKAIFLTTLSNKNFPVAAIVSCGQEENIYQYEINGVCDEHDENLDLMMLPEKKTGWINIYPNSYSNRERLAETGDIVYPTKESAVDNALHDCIATISIEWEE